MKYFIMITILLTNLSWANSDKKLYEILKKTKESTKVTKDEKINKIKITKIKGDDNTTKVYQNVKNIIESDKKIKSKIKKDEKVLKKD